MKWIAISGSWRRSNEEIQNDVRKAVAAIMQRGDGIVVGGALGVDFVATNEALRYDPDAKRIIVIIPSSLDVFTRHYRTRAAEGVITNEQAESLMGLLQDVRQRNAAALIEMQHTVLHESTYYDRNTKILDHADELYAFQVNGSLGVQDVIDKAKQRGLKTLVKQYTLGDIHD